MPYKEWYNLFYLSEALLINLSSEGKYYIEGSPVNITCEASGKPLADVAWIRNGVLESSGRKAASLKFNNISRADAGKYTCRANNSLEVTSIDTTIVVYCKYILTLIFNFWIYFIYSVTPVMGGCVTCKHYTSPLCEILNSLWSVVLWKFHEFHVINPWRSYHGPWILQNEISWGNF